VNLISMIDEFYSCYSMWEDMSLEQVKMQFMYERDQDPCGWGNQGNPVEYPKVYFGTYFNHITCASRELDTMDSLENCDQGRYFDGIPETHDNWQYHRYMGNLMRQELNFKQYDKFLQTSRGLAFARVENLCLLPNWVEVDDLITDRQIHSNKLRRMLDALKIGPLDRPDKKTQLADFYLAKERNEESFQLYYNSPEWILPDLVQHTCSITIEQVNLNTSNPQVDEHADKTIRCTMRSEIRQKDDLGSDLDTLDDKFIIQNRRHLTHVLMYKWYEFVNEHVLRVHDHCEMALTTVRDLEKNNLRLHDIMNDVSPKLMSTEIEEYFVKLKDDLDAMTWSHSTFTFVPYTDID